MSGNERSDSARRGARPGMRKLYAALAGIAVVAIGAGVLLTGSGRRGAAVTGPVPVEGLDDPERLVELARGETKGSESATVTIIEFGDFQCPACGAFATRVKPAVEQAYVESGKAKFVFYDYPLVSMHPNAFLAARAARCAADQDGYWAYHDNLYRQQSRWALLTDPSDALVAYATAQRLDERAFDSCLRSDRHAELVTANMMLAQQLGVPETPTIFVEHGGTARRVDAGLQSLSSYIDGILEESGPTGQ